MSDQEQSPFFSGDLLLTKDQITSIHTDMRQKFARRKRRTVHFDTITKWSNTRIHYEMDKNITENEKLSMAVEKALDWWTQKSCLEFVEGRPENERASYILFTDKPTCASYLGMIGGQQPIHVGKECAKPGIIAHLIGHALGLTHEHQRVDRDHHLLIHWSNVKTNFLDAFAECDNCQTHDVPYDMGSIMHIKAQAFSKNSNHTIDTDFTWPGEPAIHTGTIGSRRQGPTFFDIKKINKMYCDAKCPEPGQYDFGSYGGYWDPSNCSASICPEGFRGRSCGAMLNGKPTHCGALLLTQQYWDTFSTPNFPKRFNKKQECTWLIQAPKGKTVELEFVNQYEFTESEPCDFNFVEVRAGHDIQTTGYRFCGGSKSKPKQIIRSQTNKMIVLLRATDDNIVNQGFRAKFRHQNGPTESSTTPKKDDPFPDCEDELPTKRCVSMFLEKDKCSLPKAISKCKRTCNYCEASTTPVTSTCRDDMDSKHCVFHYMLKDECNSFRAKKRCKQTCGHCIPENICMVQQKLCPMTLENEKCAHSEGFKSWCQSCNRCKDYGWAGPPIDVIVEIAKTDEKKLLAAIGLSWKAPELLKAKLEGYHINITDEKIGEPMFSKQTTETQLETPVKFLPGLYTIMITVMTDKGNGGSVTIAGFRVFMKETDSTTPQQENTTPQQTTPFTGECKDRIQEETCIFEVMAYLNCSDVDERQRCPETCQLCVNEDPCRLQKLYCPDEMDKEGLCSKPVDSRMKPTLMNWCQKCGYCGEKNTEPTSKPGKTEKPKPTVIPQPDPDCADEFSPATCIFESLSGKCTPNLADGCDETCKKCVHPDACRLQKRHCPADGPPEAQNLCESGDPAIVSWCSECGFCIEPEVDQVCIANACPEGTRCVPESKECSTTPCPQFSCVPIEESGEAQHKPTGSTTKRWRPATKPPVDPNCKDISDLGTCLSEVLGPYDCKSPDNVLCKETCRLCSHPDPCRLQKEQCIDGTLCEAGENHKNWCDQCGFCSDDKEKKGEFEGIDDALFFFK